MDVANIIRNTITKVSPDDLQINNSMLGDTMKKIQQEMPSEKTMTRENYYSQFYDRLG